MIEGYPLVPLFENQCLGVVVLSYLGKVYWGVNADWDRVPDIHVFIDAIKRSFDELGRGAAAGPAGPKRIPARSPLRRAVGQL